MAFFWTVALLFSYLQLLSQLIHLHRLPSYSRRFPSCNNGSHRPVCIITGATSGIGAAAAEALSSIGYCVVLAGRSCNLLSKTVSEIRSRNENAHLKAFAVDISSFPSILKFRKSLEKWLLDSNMHSSIQLLINNAGILAISRRFTAEGLDCMMSTNYVGAFLLTQELWPLLKNSPSGSRIVNVTSFTHRSVFDIDICTEALQRNGVSRRNCYQYSRIYENSKLFLLLFSHQLHRECQLMDKASQVSVTSADPGAVATNILREFPPCVSRLALMSLKILGLLQLPQNGVSAVLDAALAPPEASGCYFFGGNGRTLMPSPLSLNPKLAEKLRNISTNMLKELSASEADTSNIFALDGNY